MRGRVLFFLVVSAASIFPAPSVDAADSGHFYAGVSVGQSGVDGRARTEHTLSFSPALPSSIQPDGLPFDDDDTAWSAFGGYQATPYIGVELGYWDHGTFDAARFTGLETVSIDVQELSFGATLRYPVTERFAITGGAGISRAKFDAHGTVTVLTGVVPFPPIRTPINPVLPPGFPIGVFPVIPVALADPDDETGGYWRVGVSWKFSNTLEASSGFSRRDVKVLEVDSVSVALSYAF
jgi:hypothetical protein